MQLEYLKKQFEEIDTDHSGQLSFEEMKQFFGRVGATAGDQVLRDLWRSLLDAASLSRSSHRRSDESAKAGDKASSPDTSAVGSSRTIISGRRSAQGLKRGDSIKLGTSSGSGGQGWNVGLGQPQISEPDTPGLQAQPAPPAGPNNVPQRPQVRTSMH